MTNKEIFDLYEGFVALGENKEVKLNIKASFYLARNKNLLKPYYNAIIETRSKLLDKYGEALENGNWKVPKENLKDFTKEWDAFMGITNIVDIKKIKLEDFESKIGIDLMEKLLPIIED